MTLEADHTPAIDPGLTDHEVTALQLALPRRRTLTRAEFETAWDGRLVVIEHRVSLSSFGHRLIFQLTKFAL